MAEFNDTLFNEIADTKTDSNAIKLLYKKICKDNDIILKDVTFLAKPLQLLITTTLTIDMAYNSENISKLIDSIQAYYDYFSFVILEDNILELSLYFFTKLEKDIPYERY